MKRLKKDKNKYVLVSDHKLFIENSIEALQKKSGLLIEEIEMKRYNDNYISVINNDDIEFLQDKKRLSAIPWQRLIKVDNKNQYFIYAILVLQIILLIKG